MSIHNEAEENLRVIRSLMEKATVYRAISAPGALVGGVLAIAMAILGAKHARPEAECFCFEGTWLSVLAITTAVNFGLIYRGAKRRAEVFLSNGMRLALRAMLPALLLGGLALFVRGEGRQTLTACLWVLSYAVSLLAASHFAPKSICWLGRAFFVAGTALVLVSALSFNWWRGWNQSLVAHCIMGGTFGLFHLVYAALTWPRGGGAES